MRTHFSPRATHPPRRLEGAVVGRSTALRVKSPGPDIANTAATAPDQLGVGSATCEVYVYHHLLDNYL